MLHIVQECITFCFSIDRCRKRRNSHKGRQHQSPQRKGCSENVQRSQSTANCDRQWEKSREHRHSRPNIRSMIVTLLNQTTTYFVILVIFLNFWLNLMVPLLKFIFLAKKLSQKLSHIIPNYLFCLTNNCHFFLTLQAQHLQLFLCLLTLNTKYIKCQIQMFPRGNKKKNGWNWGIW